MVFSVPVSEVSEQHTCLPFPQFELKKKGKKSCCEKFRKGKRCKSCPLKGCA